MDIPEGPPNLVLGSIPGSTPGERVELWCWLCELQRRFDRIWFERRCAPGQDIEEVLREHYHRVDAEHDSMLVAMLQRLSDAERKRQTPERENEDE